VVDEVVTQVEAVLGAKVVGNVTIVYAGFDVFVLLNCAKAQLDVTAKVDKTPYCKGEAMLSVEKAVAVRVIVADTV
jgi:hypothetical protein